MSAPLISCICLTAGRVRHLEAAIACFLSQDCEWSRELLVLNTCPRQTLALAPEIQIPPGATVKIVNLKSRPFSLGEARNQAIQLSSGTHLVTFDDDDLYSSGFLKSFTTRFADPVLVWCL